MDQPRDVEKIISTMKNVVLTGDGRIEDAYSVSEDLDYLLTSDEGVKLLKQQNKHFEVVLPLFTKIIFHADLDVAQRCFKHLDLVMEIFRGKLPKVKKGDWWKKFELHQLVELIPVLGSRVSSSDTSWVQIWVFVANLIISDTALSTTPLNKLLSISEIAFKKGKERPEILDRAWICWAALIDAFGRSPRILVPAKTLSLLMKPLLGCSSVSKYRISTWVHLIEVKGLSCPVETTKQLVESLCKAMYQAGDKSVSRHLPDDCTNALIKILSYDQVVEQCLSDVVELFGACLISRPSAGLIEQLASVLLKCINNLNDDAASYKLWKTLIGQYISCTESPILSQACQIFFTDVNFLRWVDSCTIEGKEILGLMDSSEFRDKVLLRSIRALTADEECSNRRKSRKGSCEDLWSNYCEAYLSWWSSQPPPSPYGVDKSEGSQYMRDTHDYQAALCLLLQPIQLNMWNLTVSKTWAKLCEACYRHKLLPSMVRSIFDALDKPDFQVQQAIDVSNCLFGLDNEFCKQSAKLLDNLATTVHSMEFKNVMDVLSLLEIAVLHQEVTLSIGKVLKYVNEKCSEYDQLNAHKIRTKTGKITRKLEQQSSSAEKDKPVKAQRTPFRTQSNFLQRLAKAEEKNKTKSPFLTSIFSGSEKIKNGAENGDNAQDVVVLDTCLDDEAKPEDGKKAMNPLEDSEIVPLIVLPSVLKGTPDKGTDTESIAAEKENVILPNADGSTMVTSPGCKLKITNAREVKTVDASSPVIAKKPKPAAGQKLTPKKVTPSKVSYFDDDANDCVMVPPKPRTTPLTEHQMEMMLKRRTDIPALYQDLSQDTQLSQPPSTMVQEVASVVSPQPIPESQDIVPGTPSPEERPPESTPERPKSAGKTSSSAKQLDFNNLSTPPSKTSLLNGASIREMSSKPLEFEGRSSPNLLCVKSVDADELMEFEPTVSCPTNEGIDGDVNESRKEKSAGEEKTKRKRKSEPTKFSPKLTRSKKNLKSFTPDSKSSNSQEPDSKVEIPKPLESKIVRSVDNLVRAKSPEPTTRLLRSSSPNSTNWNALGLTSSGESGEMESAVEKKPPEGSEGKSNHVDEASVLKEVNGHLEKNEVSTQPSNGSLDIAKNTPKAVESLSLEKPKKSRKRKADDIKIEDDGPSAKKSNSAKKKKKPFKLGSGSNNLENWLLKTERVSSPSVESLKVEKTESDDVIASQDTAESVPDENVAMDLNNSEEIVPSTQECAAENHQTPLPVVEIKVKEEIHEVDNEIQITRSDPGSSSITADVITSPDKPEASVLQRLSHESPNDDDIDLVISPSKRLRRAPSVFRGEGDTYLLKDKVNPEASKEMEEDNEKQNRTRNSTLSPSSKKRLHPPGGRSAKMLRMATSTTSQDTYPESVTVVTPVRRRESIAPLKYGENWPKGHTEDWVACTPVSPYTSPFRSALKKAPAPEDSMTPQRANHDPLASPLLSSAKRKRVVFLDPPVTRGLIYELDSPGGSLHHADVPQGSPYPTWKGDEDKRVMLKDQTKIEISPSKREIERLPSLTTDPTSSSSEKLVTKSETKPSSSTDLSEEVLMLVDPPEPPTAIVPSPEPDLNQFQEKFKLSGDFMATFAEMDANIRVLLIECFESTTMMETVSRWKLGDCRSLCALPHPFLSSVVNTVGEVLTEILTSAVFAVPSAKPAIQLTESSVQTLQTPLAEKHVQTPAVPTAHSESQTVIEVRAKSTNTVSSTTTSSTQADLTLPALEDLSPILKKIGPKKAMLYFSESLRLLSSLSDGK